MTCPRCQQDNPPHARFCLGCGARLALTCGSCGAELPGGARFCLQCGQAVTAGTAAPVGAPAPETYTPKHLAEKILTSKAALEGERKQVTVLFADLKGSMELLADRDPDAGGWLAGSLADDGPLSVGGRVGDRALLAQSDSQVQSVGGAPSSPVKNLWKSMVSQEGHAPWLTIDFHRYSACSMRS